MFVIYLVFTIPITDIRYLLRGFFTTFVVKYQVKIRYGS